MNVLIACEESQRVCIEFRNRGHNAFSCDIIECSGGHPEWHIHNDVIPILNGNCEFKTQNGDKHDIDKWELIIAHPPCTYLSIAGARHLYPKGILNKERYLMGVQARNFFMNFYLLFKDKKIKVCIENPTPLKIFDLPHYTQVIQPYYFGEPYKKRTCLWLHNLPQLKPTEMLDKNAIESTKIPGNWFNHGGKERQKNRSKTFIGIAKAMAEQWR